MVYSNVKFSQRCCLLPCCFLPRHPTSGSYPASRIQEVPTPVKEAGLLISYHCFLYTARCFAPQMNAPMGKPSAGWTVQACASAICTWSRSTILLLSTTASPTSTSLQAIPHATSLATTRTFHSSNNGSHSIASFRIPLMLSLVEIFRDSITLACTTIHATRSMTFGSELCGVYKARMLFIDGQWHVR